MGGKSQQQQQVNQVQTQAPWAPAVPLTSGIANTATGLLPYANINPAENAAFQGLMTNAQSGNPYAQQIGGVANTLLGGGGFDQLMPGVQNAQSQYAQTLNPYASGANVGAGNQAFTGLLDTIGTDISGRIRSQYAGAGRDFSGLEAQNVARGVSQGVAPIVAQQYNTDVERQLQAAKDLYGAAGTTTGLLSNLTQQGLGARGTGIDASTAALAARDSPYNQQLAIQQMMRGIPTQYLSQLAQIGVPIAQLGGTGTRQGTIEGSSTLSPAQQAWGWMNAFSNFLPKGGGGGGVPPPPIAY